MSQPLFISLIIAGYFFIWLFISYLSSKGAGNSTFFQGDRKISWPMVAIAMIGAPITGVTFISVPGMVLDKGYSYLQMGLGFIVGYLVIALVLIPLYYRLNIVSIYGFLEKRFGKTSCKTGAWLFFVSKILGISVRFLIVCAMLQLLVFEPIGIPYYISVLVSLIFIWISTFKGGVKSVIWGDVLKSTCLFSAIILCLYFISVNLGFSLPELRNNISDHYSSRIFYFDDPSDAKYFWKQFLAGIFIVIAMTGLDQDMMQRSLACKNAKDSRKNLIVSSLMQFVVIALLLILGSVMVIFMESKGMPMPEKTDNLFATVTFHQDIPLVVGVLFIIGLVSATYSSVASALTSMTTTVSYDLMEVDRNTPPRGLKTKRIAVHTLISLLMALFVICFYYLNREDAITTVYTLISYTDGPILGLFLFGILTKRQVNEKWLPVVCCLSPVISWFIQWELNNMIGYEIGFELLIINASLTFSGLYLISVLSSRNIGESKAINLSR